MIENGLVSVIVPIYNVEEYLPDCISSIQKQTYKKLEIILVDDGSTDHSGEICDEYAMNDSRIKVFHQENKGVSAARNVGLRNMSGEYVTFVDADDEILERFIEVFLHRMKEDGTDVVVQLRECDPQYDEKVITIDENFSYDRWRFQNVAHMKLYRINIVDDLLFDEDISYGEDRLFFAQVLLRVDSVSCVKEKMYIYKMRKDSITHIGYTDQLYTVLEANRRIATLYKNQKKTCDSVWLEYGAYCKIIYYKLFNYKDEEARRRYLLREARGVLGLALKSKRTLKDRRSYLIFCLMPRIYCRLKLIREKSGYRLN